MPLGRNWVVFSRDTGKALGGILSCHWEGAAKREVPVSSLSRRIRGDTSCGWCDNQPSLTCRGIALGSGYYPCRSPLIITVFVLVILRWLRYEKKTVGRCRK